MSNDNAYTALEDEILAFIATPSVDVDDAAFNALALRVHAFQRTRNPVYDAYCISLGVNTALDSWQAIPPVPQSVFKHQPLRSYAPKQDIVTFRTSGTTGEGFGCHHFRSLRLYNAAATAGWQQLDLPQTPLHILTQSAADAPHSSLSHMMAVLGDHAPAHCFYIDADGVLDAKKLLHTLNTQNAPIILAGTALAFLHLFETMGTAHITLPSGSVAMETGGYKGSGRSLSKDELYGLFHTHLSLAPQQVINEYGMTELSSQFYTRGLDAPHCSGHWLRTLVIDPETQEPCRPGETGTLRIFDLANLGSTLGVQTQDLAIATEVDGEFHLVGRNPNALPRGCSRSADELLGG